MLKFDPDEDDEDGPPSQSTPTNQTTVNVSQDSTPTKTAGYNCSNMTPGGQDLLSSPVNVTPNPAERGNFPYTQQDTRVCFFLFFFVPSLTFHLLSTF